MISKIIACADVHIRNLRRIDEYKVQLYKFIDLCKKEVKSTKDGDVRIVIAGDLFHNKLEISAEGYMLASWFLKSLDKVAPTLVIAGNHDKSGNNERLDPISVMFSMCKFKQVKFLDAELNYQSGIYNDDNISFVLYSAFDNFATPNVAQAKIENPHNTYVGVFHGDVKGAKTDTGYVSDNGLEISMFDNLDFVIAGHIHKFQELTYNGIPIVYCSSLIQQDHGENISNHGFVIWTVKDEQYTFNHIDNPDYGFYSFTIENENDIDDNKEVLVNL